MALPDWSLLTLDEVKVEAKIAKTETALDTDLFEPICKRATQIVEKALGVGIGRHLVLKASESALVEYHSLYDQRSRIWLLEHPVLSVEKIYEDETQTYAAGSLLTATDFVVSKSEGKVTRLAGGALTTWRTGYRVLKVEYRASFATLDAVPADVTDVVRRLAVLIYREIDRAMQGTTSEALLGAGVTRSFDVAHLTKEMLDQLDASGLSRRGRIFMTGEHD